MGNRKGRGHLSPSERAEVWRRWRTGERLAEIAMALQVSEIGVYQHIRKAGGIAERPRQRAAFALTAAEREVISRGLVIAANGGSAFGRLMAGSITMSFATYCFVNMGMVIGILPVVGVPLPWMSYGGTAMVTLGVGTGILMSINRHRTLVQT